MMRRPHSLTTASRSHGGLAAHRPRRPMATKQQTRRRGSTGALNGSAARRWMAGLVLLLLLLALAAQAIRSHAVPAVPGRERGHAAGTGRSQGAPGSTHASSDRRGQRAAGVGAPARASLSARATGARTQRGGVVPVGVGDDALPLDGPPSVSPAFVDATLARLGSPLAGSGRFIYDEGRRQGVDPVYLLAIISYVDGRDSLPAAAHNVGAIRAVGGQPALNGYRVFPTWRDGVAAWYALVRTLYVRRWGLRTLDAMLPVYAPAPGQGVEDELNALRARIAAWRAESAAEGI